MVPRRARSGQAVGDEVQPQQLQGKQGDGHAHDRGEDHDRHFRDVAAEDVADEFADVVEHDPAVADGGDDGGEVVVLEHHVGGVLGDVGTGDPHRHADVGLFQCGGVVDSVAGHGHDVALALQHLDDADLVLGRYSA